MSIIHEALKKAAAEKEPPENSVVSFRYSAKSLHGLSPSVALLSGIFFLVLFSFLFTSLHWKEALFLSLKGISNATTSKAPLERSTPSLAQTALANSSSEINNQKEEGGRALALGLNLYRQGKTVPASEAFNKAISLLPESPVAHNNLGLTLRMLGKENEAMAHYQEAIRLDAGYAEAYNNLALVYDRRGSVDQAAAHYQKALRFKPDAPEFHLNYATLLERKGDFPQAKKEYQLYLTLESSPQKENVIALVKGRLRELKGL